MRINDKFFISMDRKTKYIRTNLFGSTKIYLTTDTEYYNVSKIIQICRKRSCSIEFKNRQLTRWIKAIAPSYTDADINIRLFASESRDAAAAATAASTARSTTYETSSVDKKREMISIANDVSAKLIKFFSEFNFTPSFRFINTLVRSKDRKAYTMNYFNLQNHSFSKEIVEKIKSPEFVEICNKLSTLENYSELAAPINSRFDLYFGEPGTGKTTKATTLGDACIVCTSDMLPSDLMQNFGFSDGKAEFQKSDLWLAMEEGKTVILDEINMLPFESLRFLQGILDNKSSLDFKGMHIDIHENFKIIGTMNLNVNGQCIPLPAPLVDRCGEIKEYQMNASLLAKALIA